MPLVTVLQMSPAEFRAVRESIGWSNRELCRRVGCSRNIGSTWELGKASVPVPVGEWLMAVADAIERHPAPTNWRTRAVGKRAQTKCSEHLTNPHAMSTVRARE